ncbi:UNVERIFIED_CONTAM: Protease Do-like 7 [Sesamum calycinum]|uniref:Protease Do-like 7 n=1 Tax=Sesamum calycinum TaxID=2727403 RepID=A0AAW2SUP2_9LAMI
MERLGSEAALAGMETSMKEELCMEIDPPFKENLATADDWRKALNKVVPAVVVLRTTACRAFDTESAGASYATGFVVDKRRGIILTNRHVVKPGPVVAEAMFVNREEIPVYPIYRDPVHDFGFFRYDPSAIQFLSYEEILLAPEAACVGLEIRVVGNDSGEKVSILAGTLARLDRDAPHYKKDGYNDFNTFYMQAASGTKGGSSGSPVIDWQGRAVALNAGSKTSSASAFFLPLERLLDLHLLFIRHPNLPYRKEDSVTSTWEAVTIPRGTLQATFLHKGFDEIRRLGLRSETEQLVRHASPPGETGMLVVDSVVPDGPAHKHLEPGDVLIRLNGEVTTQFLKMENLLDDSVNDKVELQIERGGKPLSVELTQSAVNSINAFPQPGTSDSNVVLYMLQNQGTCYSELEYHAMLLLRSLQSVLVTVDRHEWYAPPQIYTRNDSSGLWNVKPVLPLDSPLLSPGVNPIEQDPASNSISTCAAERRVEGDLSADGVLSPDCTLHEPREERLEDPGAESETVLRDYQGGAAVANNASVAERVIEPTLVMLEVHVPSSCMLDGVHSQHFFGTGVIIYHSQTMGLVAVDKNTVAVSVSDVMLSFAAYPIEIPGEVVFLHPVHNFALVAYDPSALGAGASVVRAAELLPEPALRRGDSVCLVGLSRSLQATSRKSVVTNPSAALNIGSADCPRYRATNMEIRKYIFLVSLRMNLEGFKLFGEAFQHRFSEKIISGANGPTLLINGVKRPMPLVRILEVELYPTLLSKARSFGLSDSWIQALVKRDPIRRQVLRVKGCLAGSKENLLEQGDMVLAINKEPVTCFRDIEDACQALDQSDDDGKLTLTIFRQGREIDLLVGTDVRDGNGTTRVINWCGCIVQDPHSAVRALGFLPEEGHGVYVARWCHGSPVHRYGLYALQWIVEVNGKPTPDLDAFVTVTKEIEHGEFVRVRTIHLNGKPRVLTLKQDLHYWPSWELRFDPETAMWRRRTIKALV